MCGGAAAVRLQTPAAVAVGGEGSGGGLAALLEKGGGLAAGDEGEVGDGGGLIRAVTGSAGNHTARPGYTIGTPALHASESHG